MENDIRHKEALEILGKHGIFGKNMFEQSRTYTDRKLLGDG